MEVSRFDCLLRHINHTLQLLHHSHTDQQGSLLVQKATLKRNTFCPTATGKITARELFLTAPGPNRNVSLSGSTSTVVPCLFSSTSNFSNQRVPTRVRAHAVSITPLVVAHCSLPCDKMVVTGNGGGLLGHVLLGFLPVDNLYFDRAIIVFFPMSQLTTFCSFCSSLLSLALRSSVD